MIELDRISAKRGGFTIEIESLRLVPGELVAVLGNNGSGKSTFLSILAGFLSFRGDYRLQNRSFASHHPKERNKLVGLLPQKIELNMPFDVFYVILTGRFPHTDGFRYSSTDHRLTAEVIKRFDIDHLKHRAFNELSGGEKQRVLLARAFNHDTPVLLLDEPLNGIDLKHQHETVRLLHQHKKDKTILVIMHDLSLAIREFDRFLAFSQGRLVYDTKRGTIEPQKLAEIFQVQIDLLQQNDKTFVHTEIQPG